MANPATLPILLKELHLSCMASQWGRLQEQALSNHWPLAQYLTVLCENEVAHRQSLRLQRYLKESHLPATKTLSQAYLLVGGGHPIWEEAIESLVNPRQSEMEQLIET